MKYVTLFFFMGIICVPNSIFRIQISGLYVSFIHKNYPLKLVFRADDVGYTPVHLAAERGYKEILEMLIDHGGHTAFREKVEYDKGLPAPETLPDEPLRLAIKNGHYESSELLLQRGANPNAKYFMGPEIILADPVSQVR